MPRSTKLTTWEWAGLEGSLNVADGHAHQPQNEGIMESSRALFRMAETLSQKDIQAVFERQFFALNGQHAYTALKPPLYQYACSLSIEVLANHLRHTKQKVALLHPTFDNLADIMKRHGVPVLPVEESQIIDIEAGFAGYDDKAFDVLFLVLPNNPTGFEITKENFKEIIDWCANHKKLLVLDHSFRFYSAYTDWDQYRYLIDSDVSFVVFEDTGKTWPTLELKIGVTLASDDIYPYLEDITNDFLLNVSPLTFLLVTAYIEAEGKRIALANVTSNRSILRAFLAGGPLEIVNPTTRLSVEWLKLPDHWVATEFCSFMATKGVHVLPGVPFFWDDHDRGEHYIRVALQRPREKFTIAAEGLAKVALEYERTK